MRPTTWDKGPEEASSLQAGLSLLPPGGEGAEGKGAKERRLLQGHRTSISHGLLQTRRPIPSSLRAFAWAVPSAWDTLPPEDHMLGLCSNATFSSRTTLTPLTLCRLILQPQPTHTLPKPPLSSAGSSCPGVPPQDTLWVYDLLMICLPYSRPLLQHLGQRLAHSRCLGIIVL